MSGLATFVCALVSYLSSHIFHWPRKKVYSYYHYPANSSPCGETLAQRILARSERALRNVPEWANQALFTHSGILENHPWCLAWDYASTLCQNNCRLELEKRLTVDYNCCNHWNRGPGGSFSWLRDAIIQQSSLIRSKLQGSIIQQWTGCICDCKDTSQINHVNTVFIHIPFFPFSQSSSFSSFLFHLHLTTLFFMTFHYFPRRLPSQRNRPVCQFPLITNQPSFPNIR